jgi:hypothetical protein
MGEHQQYKCIYTPWEENRVASDCTNIGMKVRQSSAGRGQILLPACSGFCEVSLPAWLWSSLAVPVVPWAFQILINREIA